MEKRDFIKHQFITLRDEIRDSKERGFKIIGFGILSVPLAHFLSITYKIDIMLFSIPALVVIVALVYLAENHALMRAGTYIKFHIEPNIDDVCGWEKWLSCHKEFDSRTVDKFVMYCFFILFTIYYVASSYLAAKLLLDQYSIISFSIMAGTYVAIGLWFELFLWKNLMTDTPNEPLQCKINCKENRCP